MSCFAVATAWLFAAEALMVAGFGFPAVDIAAPDTLVLVQIIAVGWLSLCVCGAHMSGLPLNYQLLECGGRLWAKTRTAPHYKLYAMEEMNPPRPGMIRAENGVALDVEVWELPIEKFGVFIKKVPSPLCIGTVALETGEPVSGFLCEPFALKNAKDISLLGGWRAYLKGL